MGGVVAFIWIRAAGSGSAAPIYHRLTFAQGIVRGARFTDDGTAVIYSAAWDEPLLRLYETRLSTPTSTPLDLPPGHLFSVSRSGELAVSFGHTFDGDLGSGPLSRVSLAENDTSQVLDNAREAEWTPDGSALAVVRRVRGRDQLEWPIGKVLYATPGYLTAPRFSSDGRRLAFVDHPTYGYPGGDIVVVDAKGQRNTVATNLPDIRGLAWSARGDEIWYGGTEESGSFSSIRAVNMSAQHRTVLTGAVDLTLMDIDRTGRVLLSGETRLTKLEALLPGEDDVRDIPVADVTAVRAISDDGRELLITRQGSGVLLKRIDEHDPVVVGEGDGFDLSKDGQWALSVFVTTPSRLLLLRLTPKDKRELPNPSGLTIASAKLLPDAEHVAFLGGRRGDPWRGYVQNVNDGMVTRFTRPGVTFLPSRDFVVEPDGQRVALTDADGHVRLFPVNGGDPEPIPGMADGEYPLAWAADGRSVFVTRGTLPPWRIERLDPATGQRSVWKELMPSQVVGIRESRLVMSPGGEALAHLYSRTLSNLFIVDGLR